MLADGAPAVGRKKTKRKILSLGGNGMIGAETLSRLIHHASDDDEVVEYDVTMVSRGSWPVDTQDVIAPHVNFVECDRQI